MKKSIRKIYAKIRFFAVLIIFILSTFIFMANNVSAKVDNDLDVNSGPQPLKVAGYFNHTDTCELLYSIENTKYEGT